jgi:hypothetical protein
MMKSKKNLEIMLDGDIVNLELIPDNECFTGHRKGDRRTVKQKMADKKRWKKRKKKK